VHDTMGIPLATPPHMPPPTPLVNGLHPPLGCLLAAGVIAVLSCTCATLLLVNFGPKVEQLSSFNLSHTYMYTISLLSTSTNFVSLLNPVSTPPASSPALTIMRIMDLAPE
jgi:hypothetical protein